MIAVLFLVILPLISGDNEPGSPSCTISRKCSPNEDWDRKVTTDVLKARCYCDKKCVLFNDCCTSDQREFIPNAQTGLKCTDKNLPEPYYLNQKCLPGTVSKLKDLCENPKENDPLTLVAVTSITKALTYRNIFCAVCNGEKLFNLRIWNTIISCEIQHPRILNAQILRNNLRYDFVNKRWILEPRFMNRQYNNTKCVTMYSFPPAIVAPLTQKCQKSISGCAKGWARSDVQKMCLDEKMALVYSKGNVYKNFYCAICNLERVDSLTCQPSEKTVNAYKSREILFQKFYSSGEHLSCVSLEKRIVNCDEEKVKTGLCINSQNEKRLRCNLSFVNLAKPLYRYQPIFCPHGFVYDSFLNDCRNVSGKKQTEISRNKQ